MMQIHEGSQALLTHTRKLTEEERANTKGEWAYIVLKTQSSVRVYSCKTTTRWRKQFTYSGDLDAT